MLDDLGTVGPAFFYDDAPVAIEGVKAIGMEFSFATLRCSSAPHNP